VESTGGPGIQTFTDSEIYSKVRMVITGSGNVGIGTTTPGFKLDVVGGIRATGYSIFDAGTGGTILYSKAEGTGRLRVGAAWGMPGLYSGDDGAYPLILGVPAGQKVYLGVSTGDAWVEGGSGNAYIKGNVGIGTTSPTSKLEVYGGNIEINDGSPNGTYKIIGKKNFYAGDETQVSTTSTSPELKKQFTSVFDSSYGIKPRYINVIARIWNGAAGSTTYLNVTLEGCAGTVLSATSTSATLVKGSISVGGCADGLYPTKVYLHTTSGGTAYNDVIEFYYVE
jgi:hypothetical protein